MLNLASILFSEKKEEKKFHLGTCCFETGNEVDPFEYFKQNNYFEYKELENLHFLFQNIPIYYFDYKNRYKCKTNKIFEDIYFMTCVYDIYNWNCHQAAPYFSGHNSGWDYMFGFCFQRLNSGKIHTFLHSFNAKKEIFVDPTIQAHYRQQATWVNKKIWKKTGFKPKNHYKYFGIRIPVDFAFEIVFKDEEKGKTGNVWGYLIENVLCSREKTIEFVKFLKK